MLKFQGPCGTAYLQTPDEFITHCKAVNCIPLVQANAAIALVESVANATAMALDLLRRGVRAVGVTGWGGGRRLVPPRHSGGGFGAGCPLCSLKD